MSGLRIPFLRATTNTGTAGAIGRTNGEYHTQPPFAQATREEYNLNNPRQDDPYGFAELLNDPVRHDICTA